jgi:hypothetical protein
VRKQAARYCALSLPNWKVKRQMVVEAGEEGLTATEQFYALAA